MTEAPQNRDIIVIGTSAGGIDALSQVVAGLPADLHAAVFIVQHMASSFRSQLPELLSRRGLLPAVYPTHGQEIELGQIYVAPPDMQMLVRQGYVHVTRGPKENGHRPSVDTLFRSAARAYGPRVIGLVLTGQLDCGTAGLLSIKARGGIALAQDPDEAEAPSMPRSAARHVLLDGVATLRMLGPRLAELVRTSADAAANAMPRAIHELEGDASGTPAELTCPLCRGTLTEARYGDFHQFRCHVGHTFSIESVLSEQTEETERALWASVRALEESAMLARRLASHANGDIRERFEEKYETLDRQAEVIRTVLLGERDRPPALTAPEGG